MTCEHCSRKWVPYGRCWKTETVTGEIDSWMLNTDTCNLALTDLLTNPDKKNKTRFLTTLHHQTLLFACLSGLNCWWPTMTWPEYISLSNQIHLYFLSHWHCTEKTEILRIIPNHNQKLNGKGWLSKIEVWITTENSTLKCQFEFILLVDML